MLWCCGLSLRPLTRRSEAKGRDDQAPRSLLRLAGTHVEVCSWDGLTRDEEKKAKPTEEACGYVHRDGPED